MSDLGKLLIQQFDSLNEKIDGIEDRFNEKFEQIDKRFDHMENMVAQLISMNGKTLEQQNRMSGEVTNLQHDFNYLSKRVFKNELDINRILQS